jgi:hypothetical protein
LTQLYDDIQRSLLQPFLSELGMTDDLAKIKSLTISFQNKVISSSITRDNKVKLLSLSKSVQAFSEFIEEGSDELIRVALSLIKNTKGNARVAACSVNIRSLLSGAVVGAAVGGVAGAKVGCAGGMVAASGFLTRVITGVASELLTSCLT